MTILRKLLHQLHQNNLLGLLWNLELLLLLPLMMSLCSTQARLEFHHIYMHHLMVNQQWHQQHL